MKCNHCDEEALFDVTVVNPTQDTIEAMSRSCHDDGKNLKVVIDCDQIKKRGAINIGSTYTKNVNLGSAAAGYSNMGSTALE